MNEASEYERGRTKGGIGLFHPSAFILHLLLHDNSPAHVLAVDRAVVLELALLVELDWFRRFLRLDFAGAEGLAVVVRNRRVRRERAVGPHHGIADVDFQLLGLVAEALHRDDDRLALGFFIR